MPPSIVVPLRCFIAIACVASSCWMMPDAAFGQGSNRETPLVRAVAEARESVVNLRGRKVVRQKTPTNSVTQPIRQVNGMGTGVVIDPRGYILTNYHVVQDVRAIQVTTTDGQTKIGRLLAHDDRTDLALLKINCEQPMRIIPIGTSSDLMLAETVAAVGNAYGYEHTITRGIISEIGRTVPVSDDQVYYNLIQTDAPINPGNSGGPLLNLDGEMIGINVAVRIGAQGIAFAIPVNDALEVASDLMSELVQKQLYHGIVFATEYDDTRPVVKVSMIDSGSEAFRAGVRRGDEVTHLDGRPVARAVNVQSELLGRRPSETVQMTIRRNQTERQVEFPLAPVKVAAATATRDEDFAWRKLGARFRPIQIRNDSELHGSYQRGLLVEATRPGGPAEREGVRRGDVLVAMHAWKTESFDNLAYILNSATARRGETMKFYVLRDKEVLVGSLNTDVTR